jgi:hypothetical protein
MGIDSGTAPRKFCPENDLHPLWPESPACNPEWWSHVSFQCQGRWLEPTEGGHLPGPAERPSDRTESASAGRRSSRYRVRTAAASTTSVARRG